MALLRSWLFHAHRIPPGGSTTMTLMPGRIQCRLTEGHGFYGHPPQEPTAPERQGANRGLRPTSRGKNGNPEQPKVNKLRFINSLPDSKSSRPYQS